MSLNKFSVKYLRGAGAFTGAFTGLWRFSTMVLSVKIIILRDYIKMEGRGVGAFPLLSICVTSLL